MSEYKCETHKSNEGFIDEDNKWICWHCVTSYKEIDYRTFLMLVKTFTPINEKTLSFKRDEEKIRCYLTIREARNSNYIFSSVVEETISSGSYPHTIAIRYFLHESISTAKLHLTRTENEFIQMYKA